MDTPVGLTMYDLELCLIVNKGYSQKYHEKLTMKNTMTTGGILLCPKGEILCGVPKFVRYFKVLSSDDLRYNHTTFPDSA